jgi:hypothetical protein
VDADLSAGSRRSTPSVAKCKISKDWSKVKVY